MKTVSAERLVDAHVHVWDPGVLRYPWLDDETTLNRPMLPDGIDRSAHATAMIFVQAACRFDQAMAEVEWVLRQPWPELAGLVADVRLDDHSLASLLTAYAGLPDVVGVRHLLHNFGAGELLSPAMKAGLSEIRHCDLTFDATLRADQLAEFARLRESAHYPTTVLDHLGDPPTEAGLGSREGRRWLDGVALLAGQPNTFLKVSGLRDAPAALPFVEAGVALFTAQRTMLGSDFPVTEASRWEAIPDALNLSPDDRATLRWRTAARAYRIDPAPAASGA